MKQYEAVKLTIEKLGGLATLNQINQHVFEVKDCEWKSNTPFASIRRIVRHTSGIYRIKPGLYALEDFRHDLESQGIFEQTDANKNSQVVQDFNHSYYQGLLLEIGNMHHLHTFVPQQDKNRKFLNSQTLGDIRTLDQIPQYSYPNLVQRSSTIDVIWFNEHLMPHSFFEVEHSTDIQNSLLKFNDLSDFFVRMVIVADESRKKEFEKKMEYSSFSELRNEKRVSFLSYDTLDKQYELELQKQSFKFVL